MTAFSLGTVWEETIAFMRRESSLLIPVALAIFGPAQILMGIAMAGAAKSRAAVDVAASGQMLLLLPAALLVLFGNIAIALIVLTPGASVGEALARAAKSFPRALGVVLLLTLGFLFAALTIGIAATVGAVTFGADPKSPAIGEPLVLLMVIPMVVLLVRMLLLAPAIAMEKRGTLETVRRIWALGTNNVLRFAAVWILAMFLGMFISLLEQFVIGSIFALLKLAIGQVELLDAIRSVIDAGIEAMLSLGMAVYLALVYRKVAEA